MSKKVFVLFLSVVIAGSALRIIGLRWGLTTSRYFHSAAFHPDESENIKAIGTIKPDQLDFRIKHNIVTRGTFQIYLTAAWIKAASVFRLVKISAGFEYYKRNPDELVKLYVTGRSLSVLFGLATVIIVFFMGARLPGGYRTGLLASFLLAVTPLHAVWSHYIGTDIILTFLVCLVLALSFRLMAGGAANIIYIAAGAVVGLAGATKYSIAPIALIPVLAHILGGEKITGRNLLYYFMLVPAGFFIGNPYALIEPGSFIAALKSSFGINAGISAAQNTMDCFGPQNNFLFYLFTAPRYGFGVPLSLLFFFGLAYALFRRDKAGILLVSWTLIFWIFISVMSPWKLVRWQIPYIPALCIMSARFAVAIYDKSGKNVRALILTCVFAVSVYTALYSAACVKIMAQKDLRDEASEWIEANIKEGSKIAVPNVYFWNPTIVMTEHWYKSGDPFMKGVKQYKISQVWFDINALKKADPEYISLSDYEFYPVLNLKTKYPHPDMLPLLDEVTKSGDYALVKVFKRPIEIFGINFTGGFPPHDWRYINPEIRIYRKK